MKKIEKIVLIITVVIYLLAFIDFGGYEALYSVVFYTIHLVWMFIYGMLGYRVLKLHRNYIYLSMIGGFSFAMAIFAFVMAFNEDVNGFRMLILTGPNYVIALGIPIVLWIGKQNSKDFQFLKPIWYRSLIVALFVTFFTFTPRNSTVYTKTMLALNNGNKPLWYNLKALDYLVAYQKFREDGKVDEAVEAVEISFEYGLKWISKEDQRFFEQFKKRADQLELEEYGSNTIREEFSWFLEGEKYLKIEGILDKLIDAYLDKAIYEMSGNNYEQAILFLNRTLVLSEIIRKETLGWNRHMIALYWKLGTSYMRLNNLEYTDYLYTLTKELIEETETEKQFYVGEFFISLADLVAKYQNYDVSIYLLEAALDHFETDLQNTYYKKNKARTYSDLVQYYMLSDDMDKAEQYLTRSLQLYTKEHEDMEIGHTFPKVIINQALLKFLQQDYYGCKEILERNFKLIPEGSFESNTFNMLFHFYIAQCNYVLSEYEAAESSLEKAVAYAGTGGSNKVELITLAGNIKFAMGEYAKSEVLFKEAMVLYEQSDNESGLVGIFMSLANYSVKLLDYKSAANYLEKSAIRAVEQDFKMIARNLEYFNTIAYVNYHLGNYQKADSLYNAVIEYNKVNGKPNAASSGSASNGLALVKVSTQKKEEAARLFVKSIDLYKLNFNGKHAHLGTVYINYATLLIEKNELDKAFILLSDAKIILEDFYKPTHDIFADLYVAFGNLYEKKKDQSKAREYYQKALHIYVDAFGEDTIKVKLIKKKLP